MPSKKTLRQELSRLNECTGSLAKLLTHRKSADHNTNHHCGSHVVNIFSWVFQERMWQSQADMEKKKQTSQLFRWMVTSHVLDLGCVKNKSTVCLTELNPVGQTSSTQETLSHAYIRDKCGGLVFRCCSLVVEVYHIHKRPNQPVEGGGERMRTETHRWRLSKVR